VIHQLKGIAKTKKIAYQDVRNKKKNRFERLLGSKQLMLQSCIECLWKANSIC